MSDKNKIRIYTPCPLTAGAEIRLEEEQSHYLCNVMRMKAGEELLCFNAQDGEFSARITDANKKQTSLQIVSLERKPQNSPDIWLVFAPLKKDCTDFLIQKAVELGVSRIIPVSTRFGISDNIRAERIYLQMVEAAEQCKRFDVPSLADMTKLELLLKAWPPSRKLFFMDESRTGSPAGQTFEHFAGEPAAILIGPEGGFATEEANLLKSMPFVCPVSLGPRILRAETAATAALAVWQALAGDWKE